MLVGLLAAAVVAGVVVACEIYRVFDDPNKRT
jgi:hypothetical protein